ncbi:SRPBCC family protein [Bailinhaonella thermotolerans]|uniref:Carbon monoxide dehydrogenase n=1 Tax=Bailinhaonella thermotolerans TaxID=1070861 RepID=A0A3A4B1N8_9ACTN|nr:carbon monoxide dehydrogenase subunit G [Bailinhaonella thermotolerans]RJL31320.1 carbon monoxide dehydrogenase [Bailinhaonella thermotolerans]
MKLTGHAILAVPRPLVWDALRDPAVLARTIPGCERLEALGGDRYRMTVTAGVASIKGVYRGEVELRDPEPPERVVLRARGQGAPGTVEATAHVKLSDAEGGGTRIDYDADAVVGGMVGGVGQRVLASVARRTATEFFAALERDLTAAPLPSPGDAAVPGMAGAGAGPSPAISPAGPPYASGVPEAADALLGAPGGPYTAGGTRDAVGRAQEAAGGSQDAARPVTGAAAEVVPGQVFERPAKARPHEVRPWTMLAAFGMGAGVALGSAVIGWVLGRSSRR